MNDPTRTDRQPLSSQPMKNKKYAEPGIVKASAVWLVLISMITPALRVIPQSLGRDILPALVYATMTIFPFVMTAVGRRPAFTVPAIVLAGLSAAILIDGSGLATGSDILLLVALPTASGYALLGTLPTSFPMLRSKHTGILAFMVLLIPTAAYMGNPVQTLLLALPGAGPMGLTSMLLGRPLHWAPFGPAWISTAVYTGFGIAGAIAAVMKTRCSAPDETRRSR